MAPTSSGSERETDVGSVRDPRVVAGLQWLQYIEQFDQDVAARLLAPRLKAGRRAARDLMTPNPWPEASSGALHVAHDQRERARLLRITELVRDGDRVLDIGCAEGVVAATVARHRELSAYLGFDLAEAKVVSARAMAAHNQLDGLLRFEHGDGTKLPTSEIESLAPTIVLLLEVLEHSTKPSALLRSVADVTPPGAAIIFSVPLLGRIEGCWGHRTIFGAGAIAGLVEDAGMELIHVEETQNTWALCAATNKGADREAISRFAVPTVPATTPSLVEHVRPDRFEINDGDAEVVEGPQRTLVTGLDGRVTVSWSTPDATMVRVDLSLEMSSSAGSAAVALLDAEGNVSFSWKLALDAMRRRQTFVFRPGWPSPSGAVEAIVSGGEIARTRITVTDARLAEGNAQGRRPILTIWRIGFASASERPLHTRLAFVKSQPLTGSGGPKLTVGQRYGATARQIQATGFRLSRRLRHPIRTGTAIVRRIRPQQ